MPAGWFENGEFEFSNLTWPPMVFAGKPYGLFTARLSGRQG